MVTKVLLDYLDDRNVDKHKKYLYLESLDLSYSDLFELMDIYRHDADIYIMLHALVSYNSDKFSASLNKHDSKLRKNIKTKKMKRIRRESSYD